MKNVWMVAMVGVSACAATEEFSSVDQQVQATPTNVAAMALNDSRIRVTWDAVPDAGKYYVFRAEGAGPSEYVGTVVAPDTMTESTGLTASTQYSFTVESELWETSPPSDAASATTYAPGQNYVQPPSNVVAAGLDDSRIQISWTAVPNAAKYYLFQSAGSDPVQYVGTLLAPTTTWISKSLAPSSTYSFAISTAMPDGFESTGTSAPVMASTYAVGQNSVQPPTNVAASPVSESRIQLSWDAVPGAAKYYVFRAAGNDPLAYLGTVESPNVTSMSSGLAANTSYSFAVATAMPDGRESMSYSAPITASTYSVGQNNVQTPVTVTATASSESRIDLTWSAVAGASKYYLFQGEGNGPLVYTGTVLAPETTSSSFNLAASTQYRFAIGTGMPDGMDSSGYSAPVDATTYAAGQNSVQVPATVNATASSDSRIEISWTAVPGASKYYVFRAEGAGAFAYITTVVAPETTSLATGLSAGTQYAFAIGTGMPDGRDSSGMSSATSATTFSVGQNNAQVPSSATATAISESRIELAWDAVPGAAKYYVFRAEGAGPMAYIGTVVAPATSLLSANLAAGTSYSFAVGTAMPDGTESSGTSTPVSASTFSTVAAMAPINVVATATSDSRIELTWDSVPGATKYYVMRSQAGGPFTYVTSIVEPTTSFLSRSLMAGTSYAFELITVMADGSESATSVPASATTFAAP